MKIIDATALAERMGRSTPVVAICGLGFPLSLYKAFAFVGGAWYGFESSVHRVKANDVQQYVTARMNGEPGPHAIVGTLPCLTWCRHIHSRRALGALFARARHLEAELLTHPRRARDA